MHLCICESFDIFRLPRKLMCEVQVEYKCFHRGKQEGCTNEHCAKRRRMGEHCSPSLATWLPKDRVGINIYVDTSMHTFVGIRGRVMLASDEAMQANVLPPETMVLAHYLEDRGENEKLIPRVLVYDIVICRGKSVEGRAPADRYALLLDIFRDKKGFATLQWVGKEESALNNLEWMKEKLPHDIECIVNVGDDPWYLNRVLHVEVRR